eukprot:FR735055.1.p2 GENE.FR735055.1~~FR735055.1.p2  ORF type:complete len:101 (+),score=36.33 FR735055.1:702-1004(+)
MSMAKFGGYSRKLIGTRSPRKKKKKKKKKPPPWSESQGPKPRGIPNSKSGRPRRGTPTFVPLLRGVNCALGETMGNTVSWGKLVSPPHPPQTTNPGNIKG